MTLTKSKQRNDCPRWRLMLTTLLVAVGILTASAQTQTVKGVVTSAAEGEPLIGATVMVKETKSGTVTDFDGNYTLKIAKGQTLVISYIGYETKNIKYTGQATINVALEADASTLDEVVVVGYGVMKRSDITGSVVSVGEKDIKKSVITSVDQALQGRAAGVQVTQNSGSPGGGISVAIRGVNSLNGNEPLYVVDGVAIDGQTNGNSSALSAINPSDIVSMEVLKDASATAIYGSRASNGVVLITTKKGQAGKPTISYEGYYAVQKIPNKLETMNLREYAVMYNERARQLGWGDRQEFADPTVLGNGTDWQGELFRSAPMHNHQLSVSGGNDVGQYLISGGYLSQDGIAVGSNFKRFSARVNADTKIGKWLQIGVQSSFSRTEKNNTIDDANVIELALRQLPEMPARNPDGSWGYQEVNQLGIYYSNPLADALTRENYDKGLQLMINGFANVNICKGLSLRMEYGGNYSYGNNYYFQPELTLGQYKQTSKGSRTSSNSTYWSFKQYMTYMNTFAKKHSVNIMIGHEAQESKWENLGASRAGFLFNTVHDLSVGDEDTAKNSSAQGTSSIESYYGRLNYAFDERYLITATLRADGSSTFGSDNRWGWFPSVALAWRFKQESFLKNVGWLSNGKLRFGWGLVGNQNAGAYAYGATMASVATAYGTGFFPKNFANSKLKWEQTKSWNIGLDLSFFNNRIEFIFDAYLKNTDNLLMQAALPTYISGVISSPWVNTGAMRNKGFEFTLNTVNISNKNFEWTSGITFSLNRNEVTKLYTESTGIQGNINGLTYTYTTVGEPVAQFYGYQVIGMFEKEDDFYQKDINGDYLLDAQGNKKIVALPENKGVNETTGIWYGDYIYKDLNGDDVIDEQDRTFIGNPEPKFTFGINNNFRWKGFDLNLFITGSVGNKVFNYLAQQQSSPMSYWVTLKSVCNYARYDLIDPDGERTLANMQMTNPGASTYRIDQSNNNENARMSNIFVENGSYMRVKNLSIGYTFPKKWMKKVGIENLRIYFNVQNLWTITGYKGYDPEVGSYNQNVLLRGVDYARYPSQRIYTFGLNLNI